MKMMFSFVLLMSLSNAFAQNRYEFGRGETTISVGPNTTVVNAKVSIPVYLVSQDIVTESTICNVPSCSSEGGDGSNGQWFGLSPSQSIDEKANSLNKAIKGIGEKTAQRIAELNLFPGRPRSWETFSQRIRSIESKLNDAGYKYKFATNVLEVYGYDNMVNLGYSDARTCTTVARPCVKYVLQDTKTLYSYDQRYFKVYVNNQKLQSFESDKIVISAGKETYDVSVREEGVNSNDYHASVSRYDNVVSLDATRKMRPFPSYVVSPNLSKIGNKFQLTVNIPTQYLNKSEDPRSYFEVQYEVCRASIVFNTCYEIVDGPRTITTKTNSVSLVLSPENFKGNEFYVRASVAKRNSDFYSEGFSSKVSTKNVRK